MHTIAYFYPENHQLHAHPGHPERPDRVEVIVESLKAANLWDPYPKLTPLEIPSRVLTGIHSKSHLDSLEKFSYHGGRIDADTYLTPDSWQLALNSAGGACSLASAVWQRAAAGGFALCRPPGHHATGEMAMGFCLLNNVAIAAEYLLQELGAKRLAIIDLDLHHGNGTQDIFYPRGDVLYISTHQHPLYPGTGMLSETGLGAGAMSTINIPLPPFSGDTAFRTTMDQIILPALARFVPEMILVSAGMDVHWRDPLGHLLLSAFGYRKLVKRLKDFADSDCDGRIALFLEGGYDLDGTSACALAAVSALLDNGFSDPIGHPPYREGTDWKNIITRAQKLFDLPDR